MKIDPVKRLLKLYSLKDAVLLMPVDGVNTADADAAINVMILHEFKWLHRYATIARGEAARVRHMEEQSVEAEAAEQGEHY